MDLRSSGTFKGEGAGSGSGSGGENVIDKQDWVAFDVMAGPEMIAGKGQALSSGFSGLGR